MNHCRFSLESAGTEDSFTVGPDSTRRKTGLNECETPLSVTQTHTKDAISKWNVLLKAKRMRLVLFG